jgi:REP element-mobilizing transposase RayT
MPQSLVKILAHVVFSTKDRVNLITTEIEESLFSYITGTVKNNHARIIAANGTANHIHLLISMGRNDIGELIGDIKRSSSLWIKRQGNENEKFYWQRGYGAFSIGQSQVAAVSSYIRDQKSIIQVQINRLRMNFGNCVEDMRLRSMSGTVGINVRRFQRRALFFIWP